MTPLVCTLYYTILLLLLQPCNHPPTPPALTLLRRFLASLSDVLLLPLCLTCRVAFLASIPPGGPPLSRPSPTLLPAHENVPTNHSRTEHATPKKQAANLEGKTLKQQSQSPKLWLARLAGFKLGGSIRSD